MALGSKRRRTLLLVILVVVLASGVIFTSLLLSSKGRREQREGDESFLPPSSEPGPEALTSSETSDQSNPPLNTANSCSQEALPSSGTSEQGGPSQLPSRKTVCLDPGHADTPYQIDPETGLNTQDWANHPEMEIVYDICLRAREILERRGVTVILTKTSVNDPVDLKKRAHIANRAGASLILHVHTDPGLPGFTTFYPGPPPYDWKANSDSGRTAHIDPRVQAASQSLAQLFHPVAYNRLRQLAATPDGGIRMENRGATGTGNYGPIFSYDIWSQVPTFTLENNQDFANAHRQEIAEAIAEGMLACLK